jgi:hypothetical protein
MDYINFKKEGVTPEQQVKINDKISSSVNAGKQDAVIIYDLHDNHNFSLEEARLELRKAKAWMGWYAHKDSKEYAN